MNAPTLISLKSFVERAVRPVRASVSCKRRMRDELLAHAISAFDEEMSRLHDECAAIEQTALRLGVASEISRQLQETVSTWDRSRAVIDNLWSRPDEKWYWRALRQGILISLLIPIGPALAWLAAGAPTRFMVQMSLNEVMWPLGAIFLVAVSFPFAAVWMLHAMYGPRGRSWMHILLIALVGGAVFVGWSFLLRATAASELLAMAGFGAVWASVGLACLARVAIERDRHQSEWEGLRI